LVVDGWPAGLREAVINLVFNAIDALPSAPRRSGGGLHTGPGHHGSPDVPGSATAAGNRKPSADNLWDI
jgi:hypothetical protein